MNKHIVKNIAYIVIVIVLLTGCQLQQDGEVELTTIEPAELSEETRQIVSALGISDVHVFDLTRHDPDSSSISIWIEIFEHGVMKEDKLLNIISSGYDVLEERIKKSQVILHYKFKDSEETDDRVLSLGLSILDNGGTSSSSHEIVLPPYSGGRLMSPLSGEREIQLDQPVSMLTIVEDSGNGIGYSTSDVIEYDESGDIPDSFKVYDRVILFRVMLESEEATVRKSPFKL